MRTGIFSVTVAMLGMVSVLAVGPASGEPQARAGRSRDVRAVPVLAALEVQDLPDLAGFSIDVERGPNGIAMACDRGCAWKTLAFGCGDKKTCASKIDDSGMVGDKERASRSSFVFTAQATRDGMALACERGCAWNTLTFSCGEKGRCGSKITEYGMAKEKK